MQVTHYLIDNQPDEWEQLAAIYDKEGEYKRKYLESKAKSIDEETTVKNDGNENGIAN